MIRFPRATLGPFVAFLVLLWPVGGMAVDPQSAEHPEGASVADAGAEHREGATLADAGTDDREGASVADAGAERVIEGLNGHFLAIMKNADEFGYSGRCDRMGPVVHDSFDTVFMARAVIGRAWKDLSREERDRWVEAFEFFLTSTFAHRFDGYSGQTFAVLGHKPASQNTLVVMTKLTRPNDDDVRLDYRMRERPDGWKIVDIYANGKVSEVATRHAEAASLLKDGGIERLIASTSEATERHASE